MLVAHEHATAAEIGREVTAMNPAFSGSCKPFLAALGHLGDIAEAARVRNRLLALEPNFTAGRFLAGNAFERPEDARHFAQGLRLGGIPE